MLRPFNFLCRVLIKGVLVRILYIECTTEVRREMTSLLCSKTRPPKRVSTSARDLYSRVASVYLPLGEYQFTAGILPIRQSPTTTQIPIPIRLSSATRSVLLILNIDLGCHQETVPPNQSPSSIINDHVGSTPTAIIRRTRQVHRQRAAVPHPPRRTHESDEAVLVVCD